MDEINVEQEFRNLADHAYNERDVPFEFVSRRQIVHHEEENGGEPVAIVSATRRSTRANTIAGIET